MEVHAKTSRVYNVIAGLLAFFTWGGWALYVNSDDSLNQGIISGITQGVASFAITQFMVFAVTKLFRWYKHPVAKIFLPAFTIAIFTNSIVIFIHYLVGTPNIIETVAPAIVVALCFCTFTAYKLSLISREVSLANE